MKEINTVSVECMACDVEEQLNGIGKISKKKRLPRLTHHWH